MWAFARLQIPDERFFDLLGDMCVRKMELFNAQNLTNVCLRCMNQTLAYAIDATPARWRALLDSVIKAASSPRNDFVNTGRLGLRDRRFTT